MGDDLRDDEFEIEHNLSSSLGAEDIIEDEGEGEEEDEQGEDGQQVTAKKEKKKRKLAELKQKRHAKRQALDVDHQDNLESKSRLRPNDQFELFHSNQPILLDGSIGAAFIESDFFDGYQRDPGGKKPCPFCKAVAAGLPNYKQILVANSEEMGCPSVLVICAGARRAADVINSISRNLHCKVAKLFAKHFKVQDQVDALSRSHFSVVVGTPNRLSKLLELGALSLQTVKIVLVDMAVDTKEFSILTMGGVKEDFYALMSKSVFPERSHLKIAMVAADVKYEGNNF